jgi:hypothetical protein
MIRHLQILAISKLAIQTIVLTLALSACSSICDWDAQAFATGMDGRSFVSMSLAVRPCLYAAAHARQAHDSPARAHLLLRHVVVIDVKNEAAGGGPEARGAGLWVLCGRGGTILRIRNKHT